MKSAPPKIPPITKGFPVGGSVGTGVVSSPPCGGVVGIGVDETTRVGVGLLTTVGIGVLVGVFVGAGVAVGFGVGVKVGVGLGLGLGLGLGEGVGVGHVLVPEASGDSPQTLEALTSHLYVLPGFDGNSIFVLSVSSSRTTESSSVSVIL